MKNFALCLSFIFLFGSAFSQDKMDNNDFNFPRKNAVYVQNFIVSPVIYYDRIIPFNKNVALTPKVGFAWYDGIIPTYGASFLLGKKKHFAELGAGVIWPIDLLHLSLNYRYLGNKGLVAKAGFAVIPGEEGHPFLALGYAF